MNARRSTAGYSLIEVMAAVGIMIVGSTGIAMMVGATSRANDDAWESSTAAAFAATWMERVKRDSLLWTAAGTPVGTLYLGDTSGTWTVPAPAVGSGESAAADAFGWDTTDQEDMRYCVNIANQPVHFVGGAINALRVNLRLYWARAGRGDSAVVDRMAGPAGTGCVVLAASSPLIREMYLSTVVHWVAP
jgi:Tfp pilus assembly protein PilV